MKQTTWTKKKTMKQQPSNKKNNLPYHENSMKQPTHGKTKEKATISCYLPNHETNNMVQENNNETATIKKE